MDAGKRLIIQNGIVWQEGAFVEEKVLIIAGDKIEAIMPQADYVPQAEDRIIHAQGRYVLPGFIDVHIHGCNGFDTMDARQESLQGMSDFLVKQGVTGFLATTMSAENEDISKAIQAGENFSKRPTTAYLGIHLEGPYLAVEHRGSQPDTHLRAPIPAEYTEWFKSETVKMMTLAPELNGGDELIQAACTRGIVASLAHSGATYEQTLHAFEVGLRQITHTFNGMVGIHHRQPGALVAAFLNPQIPMQIIPDGIHVHAAMVKFLVQIIGIERVIIITDAMRAAGLSDGDYQLGDVQVTVKNKEARTVAGGLAGSTLTMSDAIRNMMRFCDLTLADVVPMVTSNPAKSIDMYPQKGILCDGADADLVLWDSANGVQMTLIGGQVVYKQ